MRKLTRPDMVPENAKDIFALIAPDKADDLVPLLDKIKNMEASLQSAAKLLSSPLPRLVFEEMIRAGKIKLPLEFKAREKQKFHFPGGIPHADGFPRLNPTRSHYAEDGPDMLKDWRRGEGLGEIVESYRWNDTPAISIKTLAAILCRESRNEDIKSRVRQKGMTVADMHDFGLISEEDARRLIIRYEGNAKVADILRAVRFQEYFSGETGIKSTKLADAFFGLKQKLGEVGCKRAASYIPDTPKAQMEFNF